MWIKNYSRNTVTIECELACMRGLASCSGSHLYIVKLAADAKGADVDRDLPPLTRDIPTVGTLRDDNDSARLLDIGYLKIL